VAYTEPLFTKADPVRLSDELLLVEGFYEGQGYAV
jgi:hypothetical protein